MKFLDEYRNPGPVLRLVGEITRLSTREWCVMEVCGGQTHTLIRSGIDQLLEGSIELIHGPGCPVCVTPLEKIDRALQIARRSEVILATYGDMMRVPGSDGDLLQARAQGAAVRVVYSPLDALDLARKHPDREVVFFAVGFETTAPANAMAVRLAHRRGIENFSVLCSQVRVPPAITSIVQDPECRVQGFIAPGHVCTVVGYQEYEALAEQFGLPFVVAGFEPLDLIQGLLMLVRLLEEGRAEVENQYSRAVRRHGNREAVAVMQEVFEVCEMAWRGIGPVPQSGLALRPSYAFYDAEQRFSVSLVSAPEPSICIAGAILQGKQKPLDCPAFAGECTPDQPLGAPMVSSEGACAAYFAYRGHETDRHALRVSDSN